MTSDSTPAQQALARLVADQNRPGGVTAWCDDHRPDVEIVVRELGVPALAQAVGMLPTVLYGWVERRQVERADMRVGRIAWGASPPAAPPPEPGAEPPPPPQSARAIHLRSPRVVRRGTALPQPESADYYRGLADGMKWAIERLAPRP